MRVLSEGETVLTEVDIDKYKFVKVNSLESSIFEMKMNEIINKIKAEDFPIGKLIDKGNNNTGVVIEGYSCRIEDINSIYVEFDEDNVPNDSEHYIVKYRDVYDLYKCIDKSNYSSGITLDLTYKLIECHFEPLDILTYKKYTSAAYRAVFSLLENFNYEEIIDLLRCCYRKDDSKNNYYETAPYRNSVKLKGYELDTKIVEKVCVLIIRLIKEIN